MEDNEQLTAGEEKDYVNALPVLLMIIFLIGVMLFAISTCNPKFV